MQPAKTIAVLVALGLVAVFTFQNTEPVNVTLFFWSISMSVSLMLLATLFLGIIIGMLLSIVNRRGKKSSREVHVDAPRPGHR